MNYIVFDLEWNQPMDGQEEVNEKLPFEIIEIGAVKLNKNRETVSSFSEVVCPQIYEKLNHITRKLIHITAQELQAGSTFPVVAKRFLDWCREGDEEFLFCTWGSLDVMELQRNMEYYHFTPLSNGPMAFLDVQKLFSISEGTPKARMALETVVDSLKLMKDVPFHRAYGDAYYTAEILKTIPDPTVLDYVSLDTYYIPKSRQEEVEIFFPTYSKYVSREFPDKQTAMEDRKVGSMCCPFCRKNLRRRVRYFAANSKHYLGVGFCEDHGLIKYKVRMKKIGEEGVFVVKTARAITEEELELLRIKKEKAKLIKKSKKRAGRHD